MKEDNTNKIFGKEFFDCGNEELGVFKSYCFKDLYPEFTFLATWIKNYFNPRRVLDVGCAKGFLVKAFNDLGIQAFGVDVSEYAISDAPDDVQPNLYKVDLNKDILPFEDEYFNFVTFLGTIEYLNNHKHTINELKRVLRTGGGLYLTTIYKRDIRDKIRINIHDKAFWIREFQSNGFGFVPEKLYVLLKQCDILSKDRLSQLFTNTQRKTIRFKFGKLLYQKGGFAGREIVFRWSKFQSKNYGILLFEKRDKQ